LLSGLTPFQVRHAYGFDQIRFLDAMVAGDGSGQTIAIVDAFHDPHIFSDLDVFDATFGLQGDAKSGNQSLYDQYGPSSQFLTLATPDGMPPTDPGWSLEISLDVEWAHAIAPGAKILLVEAATTSYNAILDAVDYARRQMGVVAVSMSWGSEEFEPEAMFDTFFTTPYGHLGGSDGMGGFNLPGGVSFVAASGDYGSPEWPAVSPNVLAVGGTTLNLDSAGNYQFETPWVFSGGGISFYQPRPAYQSGTPSSNSRSNPDVGFAADPRSGFAVYDTVGISGLDGWLRVGGTSAGAPQWAALIAIADQGRALMGYGALDGFSQTLPAIYALPDSVFHSPQGAGPLIPGSTYSLETGRGTPIANLLIPALPGVSPPPVPGPTPVANAPGSPTEGSGSPVGAPGSPPKKTDPPSKTDRGHPLAVIPISQAGETPTPSRTLNPLAARTPPPTAPASIVMATPPRTLDGPVITGIGSIPETSPGIGLRNNPIAEVKEEQEFIGADVSTNGALFIDLKSVNEIREWKIETMAVAGEKENSFTAAPTPIAHAAPDDTSPPDTVLPLNRNWERVAFLLIAVATLLGPYSLEAKRQGTK